MANLLSGLGGSVGFGEQVLPESDDGSFYVDATSIFEDGINFFGKTYDGFYINTNGSITFGAPNGDFSPNSLGDEQAGLYAFWDDFSTFDPSGPASPGGNSQGTGKIYYDLDEVNDRIVITWDDVHLFGGGGSPNNAFQIILVDTSGAPGGQPGDFNAFFNYERIDVGGAFGDPRAGYTPGPFGPFQELPQSGNLAAMLNLETDIGNTGVAGLWRAQFEGGYTNCTELTDGNDVFNGTGAQDCIVALDGNDAVRTYGGADIIDAGDGRNLVQAGAGSDYIVGGDIGEESLFGGGGGDFICGNGDDDRIGGNGGWDSLVGGEGNDTISGDGGGDTINGGNGNDVMSAGQSFGRSGDGALDVFEFDSDDGIDLVFGMTAGVDQIHLTDGESYALMQTGSGTHLSYGETSVFFYDALLTNLDVVYV